MVVAERLQRLLRKLGIRYLGLLETDDIGVEPIDESFQKRDAEPHRIDVPCHESHGRNPLPNLLLAANE